jgi:chitodextrinase
VLKKLAISMIALTFIVLSCSDDSTGPADGTAPATINDLAASNETDSSITLTWTAPGDDGTSGTATAYDIRYGVTSFQVSSWLSAIEILGEPTPHSAGSTESFTVNGLSANTRYYFGIVAKDEIPNQSEVSNIADGITVLDSIAPSAVTDLEVIDSSTSSVTLTWTATGDDTTNGIAAKYDIRYATFEITEANWNSADTVVGESFPRIAGSADSVEVVGLMDNTEYYFAMKVRDSHNNWSILSNLDSATTKDMEEIADLSVIDSTRSSITLTWTTPGDTTDRAYSEYLILYEITGSGSGFIDTALSVPAPKEADIPDTFTVIDLVYDTSYTFLIMIKDEAGNWSDTSNFAAGLTRWSRFTYPVNYNTSQYTPTSAAVADIDGDTDIDFVVVNSNSNSMSVFKNNGSGVFTRTNKYEIGNEPTAIFAADLDNDLDIDLAVANYRSHRLKILRNNGSGTFSDTSSLLVAYYPTSVYGADFDGDNDIDLAVTGSYLDSMTVLLNNGSGAFSFGVHSRIGTGDAPSAVVTGDLDNDLDYDIIVTNMNSDNISVYLNDGDSAYFPFSINYPVGDMPGALTLSDVDGDTYADIIVTNINSNTVSVLMNNGDGSFSATANYAVLETPRSVTAADLNDDTYIDLAVANYDSDSVSVLLGVGNGTFQTAINYLAGHGPRSIKAADFDNDTYIDLVVANRRDNNVSLLWNKTINE